MEIRYTLSFCLILFILWSFPAVNAQNSQGLSWGVVNDTQIYYQVEYSSDGQIENDTPNQEIIYLDIQDLPEIPDYVNTFTDFYIVNLTTHWENGTQFRFADLARFPLIVFPIGNWSLYSEWILGQEYGPNNTVEIIDTLDVWSLNQISNTPSYDTETIIEFSKIDGCLSQASFISRIASTGDFDYRNEITRIESNIPILITSGAVIVIEVVIAAVILKKFKDRSAKEPTSESGEIKWEDVFPP